MSKILPTSPTPRTNNNNNSTTRNSSYFNNFNNFNNLKNLIQNTACTAYTVYTASYQLSTFIGKNICRIVDQSEHTIYKICQYIALQNIKASIQAGNSHAHQALLQRIEAFEKTGEPHTFNDLSDAEAEILRSLSLNKFPKRA